LHKNPSLKEFRHPKMLHLDLENEREENDKDSSNSSGEGIQKYLIL
jgi:hypothetical protein